MAGHPDRGERFARVSREVSARAAAGTRSVPSTFDRRTRLMHRRRRLRVGLMYVCGAIALGVLVPKVTVGPTVTSNRIVDMLLAVGAGFVPFIGIVYSMLFLVVQFGTTTFTPRLNLFRDAPIVQHAFAYYTGVLIFSFTAALSIGQDDHTTALVPILLGTAVVLAVVVFRALQSAAFSSIQLATTLAQVRERGREVIDHVYPRPYDTRPDGAAPTVHPSDSGQAVLWPGHATILQAVDVEQLMEIAEREQAVIVMQAAVGQQIYDGQPLARVHGGDGANEDVMDALSFGIERTFDQDPALALRVLADIALRALSSALNDPSTAIQALDGIEGLLRVLAVRDLDVSDVQDNHGTARIVLKLPSWDDYVETALDEVISTPTDSALVPRRIQRLLTNLIDAAPAERHDALERRLEQLTTPATS